MARNKNDEAPIEDEPTPAYTDPAAEPAPEAIETPAAAEPEPEVVEVASAEPLPALNIKSEVVFVDATPTGGSPWTVALTSAPGDPAVRIVLQFDSTSPVCDTTGPFTVTIKESK